MKFTLIVLASLLISACVNTPQQQFNANAEQLNHWQATGKLGVRNGSRAKAVNFNWQNTSDAYEIHLHGILGIGSSRLSKRNGVVELKTKDGVRQADSAASLLQDLLGLNLPVDELSYWIKGISSPKSTVDFQQYYESGELEYLQQQGWRIHFQKYHQIGSLKLPKKIVATRDQLKLTIAIKRWRI